MIFPSNWCRVFSQNKQDALKSLQSAEKHLKRMWTGHDVSRYCYCQFCTA